MQHHFDSAIARREQEPRRLLGRLNELDKAIRFLRNWNGEKARGRTAKTGCAKGAGAVQRGTGKVRKAEPFLSEFHNAAVVLLTGRSSQRLPSGWAPVRVVSRAEGESMTKPWEGQPWFERYRLALFETNSHALPARIETAEAAIKARMAELDRHNEQELNALRDALSILQLLIEEETKKWGP